MLGLLAGNGAGRLIQGIQSMRTPIVVLVVAARLAGCHAQPKASQGAAPVAIASLTDQTLVYSCPSCGMDYDRAGQCPMCKVALVATRVAYICPADDQPVARSGKCPRCNANARVIKTAVAAETKTPPAAGAGAANGS